MSVDKPPVNRANAIRHIPSKLLGDRVELASPEELSRLPLPELQNPLHQTRVDHEPVIGVGQEVIPHGQLVSANMKIPVVHGRIGLAVGIKNLPSLLVQVSRNQEHVRSGSPDIVAIGLELDHQDTGSLDVSGRKRRSAHIALISSTIV